MEEIFNQVTFLSALAVVAVQQILKLKAVPLTFANKYPVPTNIFLSIVATLAVYFYKFNTLPADAAGWLTTAGVIAISAAIAYNALPRNWNELRAMESGK